MVTKKALIFISITIIIGIVIEKNLFHNMTFNVNKINNNYSQKEVLNAKGQRFIVQPPQPLINGTLGNPDLSINNTKQINTISLVETDIENTNNSNNSNEAVAKRLIINPNNITEIPLLDLTKQ